jgi:transposase
MLYAAIDIHKHAFQAAVLDPESGEVVEERFSADRESLARWAEPWRGRVSAVAIEATTGWRWVWRELVERGFEVRLAEPVQTRALLGRRRSAKTDRLDARWLARLLAKEMLPESWIPPAQIQELRDRTRRWPRTGAAGVSACTPTCCTRAGPARGRICCGRRGCAGRPRSSSLSTRACRSTRFCR